MNNGDALTIEIEAFYCPKATQCLLCTQQLVQHLKKSSCQEMVKVEVQDMHLVFQQGKRTLYVDFDPQNNLPICHGTPAVHSSPELNAANVNSLVTSSCSQNLSNAQKELLQNHFKFGHLSMQKIQASKCETPKCTAYQFAKARK
jgi:hypothetical protein